MYWKSLSLFYLTPVEYIERELTKIRSPVLPMWSASTVQCYTALEEVTDGMSDL